MHIFLSATISTASSNASHQKEKSPQMMLCSPKVHFVHHFCQYSTLSSLFCKFCFATLPWDIRWKAKHEKQTVEHYCAAQMGEPYNAIS